MSILFVSFFFAGKLNFATLGLKLAIFWRSYLLVGLIFALFHLGVRSLIVEGMFSRDYSLPLALYIPAYLFLGLLIGLAEESAFRGYILKNLLEIYKPAGAVLFSSILFGIYHVNFIDLNWYRLVWWVVYTLQALTAGIFMGFLYYKTGCNLIGSITYHSAHIIIGQIIPWTPLIKSEYLLLASTIINIVQIAILKYLRIARHGESS